MNIYSVLSADLVYVLLFPQLLLIIHWKAHCNSYGSIVSMLTGFIFRILGTVIETKLIYWWWASICSLISRIFKKFFRRRTSSRITCSPGLPLLRPRVGSIISLPDVVHDHRACIPHVRVSIGILDVQKQLRSNEMGRPPLFWRRRQILCITACATNFKHFRRK